MSQKIGFFPNCISSNKAGTAIAKNQNSFQMILSMKLACGVTVGDCFVSHGL